MSLILSEHFRLAEFTTSLVAVTQRIDNTPPLPAICNLQQLCLHVPGAAAGPSRPRRPHQQRLPLGEAQRRRRGRENLGPHARLRRRHLCPRRQDGPPVVCLWMMDNLPFDQLIWETASAGKTCWIHVGYRGAGRNRQQVIGHLVKR